MSVQGKCGPSCCTAARMKPVSPICSKADLNFFENWVKLLQCKGLEDTLYGRSGGFGERSFTTSTSHSRWAFVNEWVTPAVAICAGFRKGVPDPWTGGLRPIDKMRICCPHVMDQNHICSRWVPPPVYQAFRNTDMHTTPSFRLPWTRSLGSTRYEQHTLYSVTKALGDEFDSSQERAFSLNCRNCDSIW